MFEKLRLLFIVIILASCSTIEKAKLLSDNTTDAIAEVKVLRNKALTTHVDLLVNKDYLNGENLLNGAIDGDRKNKDKKDILEDLAHSKSYFVRGINLAKQKIAIPERILEAREATLFNDVKTNLELSKRLDKIDVALREESKEFTKILSVGTISLFEKDYLVLEIDSVKNNQLREYREILSNAEKNSAKTIAPKTFLLALNDLKAAENMIQQSPRNPENYINKVSAVKKSTKLLQDVMGKLKGIAKKASENAALILVHQDRKLGQLSIRAKNLKGELSDTQADLDIVSENLDTVATEASRSAQKVQLQNNIEHVRGKFTLSEADVYQQGNNLIIRLKKMDFKFGSAVIPNESMAILTKVNFVIESLNSSNVMIEGHTDSIGDSNQNQILSVDRSDAVARHLKSFGRSYKISSKGFGETKPIANNETKVGRKINRRVDIVITAEKKI